MRLHRLVLSAFGPFADTVDLDLDAVADQGLFLIRGATGAGKTSLLDGVAFALYSDVPGSRSKKGLHSDHAAPGTVPQVTLEFTASGRRFRVERSPEFRRPKSRGSGETSVPAKAVLLEQVRGGWTTLSTRHDEIADVMQDVLGLGLQQFSKVVLLPQGEFATFLRASPEERRELLERLFDVSTFTALEEWFALRRKESATEVESHRAALQADLGILTEVLAGAPAEVSETWPDWAQLDPGALVTAVADAAGALDAAATTTLAALDAGRLADSAATSALAAAERVGELRRRATAAQARHAALVATRPAHDRAVATLEAAARAATVQGDLKALGRAETALGVAREAVAAARSRVARLGLDDRSPDGVRLVLDRIEASSAVLEESAVRAAAVRERTRRRDAVLRRHGLLESSARELAVRAEQAATAVDRASESLEDARTAAAALDASSRLVEDLERRHRLRVDLDEGVRRARTASAELSRSRQQAQDLREVYQNLRQAQLDGMAAELAARLEDGAACPVCGALDHPIPARSSEPVTAEVVDSAEEAWRRAESAVATHASRLAALEAATQAQGTQLGDDGRSAEELGEAVRGARAGHQALLGRAGREADLERAREETRTAAETAAAALSHVRHELTASAAAAQTLERDLAAERDGLAQALARHDDCPCMTLLASDSGADSGDDHTAVRHRHEAVRASVQEYAASLEREASARAAHDGLAEEVRTVLADAGFAGADQARSALLSAAASGELRATVAEWEQSLATAQATLDDAEVQTAVLGPEPDVEGLASARDEARAALLRASSADTLVRRTLDGLGRVRTSIEGRSASLGTALAEFDLTRELADTLGGGGSNTLRMRLSSFVLAARLEKVVALANERLAGMGDGRYQLRHTDGLAARGARSGLGLEVLDLWTGQARETSSLSGGESFMASLALALGLADAVREESGGFELQTLFVDEGFGTLDDDSLEQVMDVLDGLREGGRAVGVVSHVAELRSRIPSQVVVGKTERGSTVRIVGAEGAAPAA